MDMNLFNVFLRKENDFYRQLTFLLIINVFAGGVLSGYFFVTGSLYHDNLKYYSIFHDNLHSLNYFGEVQWWHPNVQQGFPAFYLSILGTNSTTPLFAVISLIIWILGLFGVYIKSFLNLYIIYFGFLIPLLFSFSLLLLLRQMFDNNKVIIFILLLAAFSPGIIFILSDVYSLEQSIYSLFFAAAYLRFQKEPGKNTFWALCLTLLLVAVSFNFYSFYWNIIFVPLFIVIFNSFGENTFLYETRGVINSVPKRYWVIALFLIIICLLPSLMTSRHTDKFIRTHISQKTYDYSQLKSGNPLEFLTVSTPGIGYNWDSSGFDAVFSPYLLETNTGRKPKGYSYMGLLVLTLTFVGLIGGKEPWRTRLFFLIALSATIIILSGYSPLFSALLVWPSPIRANNHFSDAMLRSGGFILFLLSAGLGMEVLINRDRIWRYATIAVFTVFSFGSILLLVFLQLYLKGETGTADMPFLVIFGFFVVMILLYLIVLFWFAGNDSERARERYITYLMILAFIDISTCAFWHTRTVMWNVAQRYEDPPVNSIGLEDVRSTYVGSLLKIRHLKELEDKGMNFSHLPKWMFFRTAHADSIESFVRNRKNDSLVLPDELRNTNEFRTFFDKGTDGRPDIALKQFKQTYNMLRFEVELPEEALFFWRDAYFPYWEAIVNGKKTDIARGFWGFKAVAVPSGKSTVDFRFSPGYLPYALLASYMAILATLFLWIFNAVRRNRQKF